MLEKYMDVLTCSVCSGPLTFSGDSTVDEYAIYMAITHLNLNVKVDELINDYLVYNCNSCGLSHKYTSREIEKLLRKKLTERALLIIIRGMTDNNDFLFDTHLIYCNKCQGMDGQGSCLRSVYDKCQIKRFPINGL